MNGRIIAAAGLVALAAGLALYLRGSDRFPSAPPPGFRVLGPQQAPVKVVEFSDFACPACATAWESLENMAQKYPKFLKVEFKHYPLTSIHPWSMDAAMYADCAGRQGRFREYAGLLFSRQKDWARGTDARGALAAYGKQVGLDSGALEACLADPETSRAVERDMAEGARRKIESTPTFIINGKRAVGPAQLMHRLKYLTITVKPEQL